MVQQQICTAAKEKGIYAEYLLPAGCWLLPGAGGRWLPSWTGAAGRRRGIWPPGRREGREGGGGRWRDLAAAASLGEWVAAGGVAGQSRRRGQACRPLLLPAVLFSFLPERGHDRTRRLARVQFGGLQMQALVGLGWAAPQANL
jgi:hypothetical protein